MSEEQNDVVNEKSVSCEHYNPVYVRQDDTVGAIFLGIVAIALLVALMRALRHNQELVRQLQFER